MVLRVDNNMLKILKKYRKRRALTMDRSMQDNGRNINPDIDAAIENGQWGSIFKEWTATDWCAIIRRRPGESGQYISMVRTSTDLRICCTRFSCG